MYKIIKIEDGVVYVGKSSDSQFIEISQSNFGFEPVVGDYVEFYKNGETYIVSKVDQLAQFANFQGVGGQSDKSKIVAAILAFLGAFGFYEFYIGNTGKGILRVLLTIVGSIPFILPLMVLMNIIWNVINMILVLTSKPGSKWHQDAQGRELRD